MDDDEDLEVGYLHRTIYVREDVNAEVVRLAKREHRSISSQYAALVEEALATRQRRRYQKGRSPQLDGDKEPLPW